MGSVPPLSASISLCFEVAVCRALLDFLRRKVGFLGSPHISLLKGTRIQKHTGDAVAKIQLAVRSYCLVFHEFQILWGKFQLEKKKQGLKRQVSALPRFQLR